MSATTHQDEASEADRWQLNMKIKMTKLEMHFLSERFEEFESQIVDRLTKIEIRLEETATAARCNDEDNGTNARGENTILK